MSEIEKSPSTSNARNILRLALPVIAGSLLETLYNLTDAFFLGKLGIAEFSAPSIAFNIVFFLIVFGLGLSGAGATLIAQSKGKGDRAKMDFYLAQMTVFLSVGAVVLSVVGIVLARPLLILLQTPESVFGHAHTYMTIVFAGIPFMFGYFVLQAGFAGAGDTFTPLVVHLIAVAVNVVLDPILIFGIGVPPLGVAGAAIATVVSQAIASVISFAIMLKGKGVLKLRPRDMKPDGKALSLFVKIGLPASLGDGISALGFTVLQGLVNSFGPAVIAAFGAGNRIMGLFDVAAGGVSQATATLSGHALGAKDPEAARRVTRSGILVLLCFVVPLLAVSFFAGGPLVRFFVDDPEAVALGDVMFKIVGPSILLFDIYHVLTGVFRGAGSTGIVMTLSIVRLWAIRVPLAYVLALAFSVGPYSIWIAMFFSNLVTSALGYLYYRSGRWTKALDPDSV